MASTTGRRPWQEIALRSAYSLVGVAIIGLGAAVMLVGGVGVDPFTALNTGISDLIGWSLGTWQLVANAILLVFVLIWGRQFIGTGTVINMVLTGYFITWFSELLTPVIPADPGLLGMAVLFLIGIAIFDFGASAYMSAGVGTAPYDAIAPMIVDKSRFSYRWVRTIQDIITVTAAWLCHGPVGVGTFATAFFNGPLIEAFSQKVNSVLVGRLVGLLPEHLRSDEHREDPTEG